MQEQFDEGYSYDKEMRPRGIKIYSGYWPADLILDRLPNSKKDVCLVLTSMDLKRDFGRIHGKWRSENRSAIASSMGFTNGYGVFHLDEVSFNAITFGEIGHALGLKHHEFNPSDPCEMSHNLYPDADWKSLDEVRFCDNCYKKIR